VDDYYNFRKIKSTALVMIAIMAVHIALSIPLGYYWNALQAKLSGVNLTVQGVPEPGDSTQGVVIYLLLFGAVAALAFLTTPRRTSIWWRLVLIVPLSVYLFSAYVEYGKISPVGEKFKDIYESLEYAIFVPYAAIAFVTALYVILVIAVPWFRGTQVFGWATAVVAILSYLASAVFIVYNHTMTILEGAFGTSDFYTYLAVFALDVVSYFFLLSVLMTYCTIKREERWDRLEAYAMETELEEMEEEEIILYEAPARESPLLSRVIPDIEDLKEHEATYTGEFELYRQAAEEAPEPEPEPEPEADGGEPAGDERNAGDPPQASAGDETPTVVANRAQRNTSAGQKRGAKRRKPRGGNRPKGGGTSK
jgi:hypothetical protein